MSDSFQYKAVYNAATQTWIGNWSWDTRKASNSERLKVYESVKTGLQALGPPYTWTTEKRDKARQLLMLEDGFKYNLYKYTEEEVERLFNHHREFTVNPIMDPNSSVSTRRTTSSCARSAIGFSTGTRIIRIGTRARPSAPSANFRALKRSTS